MIDSSAMSAIDAPVELRDLLSADELRELVESFSRYHGAEVTIADSAGALTPERDDPVLREQFAHGVVDRTLRTGILEAGDRVYRVQLLIHDGERVGALAIGPYVPVEQADSQEARERSAAPALTHDAASSLSEHVARVLDVLIHNSYVRHLTSAVHVASMSEAYGELKAKNERLERAMVRMQELDRLKSGFLATMSHELRTPLTSVIGYAEMLAEGLGGPLSDEQREYIDTILSKSDQLLQLISGILDAALVEAGRLPIRCEPFPIAPVVESLVSTFRPHADKRRIAMELLCGDVPKVVGDGRKVRQALWNLLNNAIKFTREGGRIAVAIASGPMRREAVADSPDGVRISITDSGIGIPPEHLSQIFEPFFQVDSSSTREYGGAGLGLTVAKQFIEAQDGRIWVDSAPGQGSVFTVSLPAAIDEPDAPEEPGAPGAEEPAP